MPLTANAMQRLAVDVRPLVASDEAFVFATWLNHVKSSSRYGRALERDIFFKSFHRTIDAVLRRPSARVFVACPHGAPEVVGYLVTDAFAGHPLLHFAYVKKFAQGNGVFSALLSASGIDVNEALWSCPTDAEDWVMRKWPGLETLDLFR